MMVQFQMQNLHIFNGVTSAIQTQMDAKAATTYVDNAVAGLRTRIIAECAFNCQCSYFISSWKLEMLLMV